MNISKSLDYLHCHSFSTLGNETSIYDPITRRCTGRQFRYAPLPPVSLIVSLIMKKIWSFAKQFLFWWGILCALAIIIGGAFIAYQIGPGNKDKNKVASNHDVRYVLNWCNLGDERIEEVLHSYVSSRSFTGDHLDAHAIRISRVAISELKQDDFGSGWWRGDQVTGVLKDALNFVDSWLPSDEIPWFLQEEEITSSEIYIYPWSIYCHGTRPTAVELIFVRPRDKMVFFFGAKT